MITKKAFFMSITDFTSETVGQLSTIYYYLIPSSCAPMLDLFQLFEHMAVAYMYLPT